MTSANDLIRILQLQPHPREGGYFRETYRATETMAAPHLPSRYQGQRCHSTAIYYLLTPTTFSALHRLQSDEIFHFYSGDPVRMLQLQPDGTGRTVLLGRDVLQGQSPQVIVPCGVWQGSLLEPGGAYALLGCTVAPGFEYADYETGRRDELLRAYPAFGGWINKLSHE
jgi:predicted cupin superfamily sugar epimerase